MLRRTALAFFACATVVGSTAQAQLRWVHRAPAHHPLNQDVPNLFGPNQLVYNPDRRVCVWTNTRETWEWDGVDWARKDVPALPVNAGLGLTYDSARHVTVLVSYMSSPPMLSVWEWNGVAWTIRPTTGGPTPGRVGYLAQYDPNSDSILLSGGYDTIGHFFADCWELNGSTWTSVASPSAIDGHASAYDSTRRRVMLVKPDLSTGPTYARVGAAWTLQSSMPGRMQGSMAYDPDRDRLVFFGGWTSWNTPGAEQWEYDGATWTRSLATGPSARVRPGMAYDTHRHTLVLFGGSYGLNDTWELSFCPADFNHSGVVDSQDLFDYLSAFFNDLPSADTNGDSLINSQDFFEFLSVYFTGC